MDELKEDPGTETVLGPADRRALPPDRRWWVIQNLWAFLLLMGSAYCIGLLSLYFGAGVVLELDDVPELFSHLLPAFAESGAGAADGAALVAASPPGYGRRCSSPEGITMGFYRCQRPARSPCAALPCCGSDLALVTEAAKHLRQLRPEYHPEDSWPPSLSAFGLLWPPALCSPAGRSGAGPCVWGVARQSWL